MAEKYNITKKEEVYNLLKNKRNFEYMSEPLLRKLIDVMKVVRFREERLLIKQGAENAFCYIIIRGSVSVYVDGKFLYKLRRTGDVFGEISFVTQSISTATIKAEKDLGVIVISYNFFNKLKNIELALWLARVIGEKLIRTSKIKSDSTDVAIEKQNTQTEISNTNIEISEPMDVANSESEVNFDETIEESEIEIDTSSNGEDSSELNVSISEQSDDSTTEPDLATTEEDTVIESNDDSAEPDNDSQNDTDQPENNDESIETESTTDEIIDLESDEFK